MIHTDYRKCGEDNIDDNYKYFLTRMLERISVKRTKYKERRGGLKISDCFSASDEAFALMIIDNAHQVWDRQIDLQVNENKGGPDLRMPKKYVDCSSGNASGWTKRGIAIYNTLCVEIQNRRKVTEKDEENVMRLLKDDGDNQGSGENAQKDTQDYSHVKSYGKTYFDEVDRMDQVQSNNLDANICEIILEF